MEYRVFISHTWNQQSELYYGLERLLRGANRFDLRNLSVPRQRRFDGNYEDARSQIYEALRQADVVLVINTPAVTRSSAVRNELEFARTMGIPIVVVGTPSRHGPRNGSTLLTGELYQARWTTQSIVSRIRDAVRSSRNSASNEKLIPDQVAPTGRVILFPISTEMQEGAYEQIEAVATPPEFDRAKELFVRGDDEAAPTDLLGSTDHRSPTPKDEINATPVKPSKDQGLGSWVRQMFGLSNRHPN